MGQSESGAAWLGGGSHVDGDKVQQYQELWLSLARWDWGSMVLVPAEPGGTTEPVARALAEVGKRLSREPVTAVTAAALEYGTALALAEMPSFVDRRRLPAASQETTVDLQPSDVRDIGPGTDGSAIEAAPRGQPLVLGSAARIIISLPAVVSEPLGLATTQNADLVILCVEVGSTRLDNARKTMELIGRDRVAGCILLR